MTNPKNEPTNETEHCLKKNPLDSQSNIAFSKKQKTSFHWEPLGTVRDYLSEQMRHDRQW